MCCWILKFRNPSWNLDSHTFIGRNKPHNARMVALRPQGQRAIRSRRIHLQVDVGIQNRVWICVCMGLSKNGAYSKMAISVGKMMVNYWCWGWRGHFYYSMVMEDKGVISQLLIHSDTFILCSPVHHPRDCTLKQFKTALEHGSYIILKKMVVFRSYVALPRGSEGQIVIPQKIVVSTPLNKTSPVWRQSFQVRSSWPNGLPCA